MCSCGFNDAAATEVYTYGHTLSRHSACPGTPAVTAGACADATVASTSPAATHPAATIFRTPRVPLPPIFERMQSSSHVDVARMVSRAASPPRSEEHPSELQSLMRNSYAVFCLKNKKQAIIQPPTHHSH